MADPMRAAGNKVNEFIGDVGTATAPGAMSDLPGFILDNIKQYLSSFGPANEKRAALFKQLQQGAAEPGLLHDLIGEAMNVSNPIAGILGPIGKVTAEAIGSAGGAKAINQAQKKIVKAIFRGDPKVLEDVVKSPGMMHVGVPGAGGAGGLPKEEYNSLIEQVMGDAFAHFQPGGSIASKAKGVKGGTVRFHPQVLRGIDPHPASTLEAIQDTTTGKYGSKITEASPILQKQGVEGVPDMAVHEATHFLNEPTTSRFYDMAPGDPGRLDARRLANALYPFLAHAKFGPRVVGQKIMAGQGPSAMSESLSYLAQPTGRNPAGTWLNSALTGKPREGGIGQFEPEVQRLLQEALDAAKRIPGLVRE